MSGTLVYVTAVAESEVKPVVDMMKVCWKELGRIAGAGRRLLAVEG